MGKSGTHVQALCASVEQAFNLLGKKWAGLVIRDLSAGPRHFSDLERGIPSVSARVLAERVKELEAAGLLTRTVHTESPVRVVYELTEKGRALIPVMAGIEQWARTWNNAEAAGQEAARLKVTGPQKAGRKVAGPQKGPALVGPRRGRKSPLARRELSR